MQQPHFTVVNGPSGDGLLAYVFVLAAAGGLKTGLN